MKVKPAIPRKQAQHDIDEAIAYYLEADASGAALNFIDALEKAFTHISRHPRAGSPRSGHELDLPGLRSWSLSRHSFLIFYIERRDHIDVWRVLHGRRDIPTWMQHPDAQE